MLIPHYLKAADEAALWAALDAAGLAQKVYDPEDPLNQNTENDQEFEPTGVYTWAPTSGYDLDIIGDIYKPTGETDAEGNPIMIKEDGYFANIRSWDNDFTEEQLAVLPTIPTPAHPVRTWAGDESG
jgi:hypothetical protein